MFSIFYPLTGGFRRYSSQQASNFVDGFSGFVLKLREKPELRRLWRDEADHGRAI
jgi:hypothetical protein